MKNCSFRFCSLFLCTALTLAAQQPAPAAAPASAVAPHGSDRRISINVQVSDKSGKPVVGLTQNDFALTDNGIKLPVAGFKAATMPNPNPPVSVIIVLDEYNLNISEVARERDELKHFLNRNNGQLALPTSIVIFSDTGVTPSTHPVTNGVALAHFIDLLPVPPRGMHAEEGKTVVPDHFNRSVETLRAITNLNAAKQPGHKLLIWTGRGWPVLHPPGLKPEQRQTIFSSIVELSGLLRQADITFYQANSIATSYIGLSNEYFTEMLKPSTSPENAQFSNLSAQILAGHTGGQMANEIPDLDDEITECETDAKAFYVLSFDAPPTSKPDDYHALTVTVNKPLTTVRTLAGYYSQP